MLFILSYLFGVALKLKLLFFPSFRFDDMWGPPGPPMRGPPGRGRIMRPPLGGGRGGFRGG